MLATGSGQRYWRSTAGLPRPTGTIGSMTMRSTPVLFPKVIVLDIHRRGDRVFGHRHMIGYVANHQRIKAQPRKVCKRGPAQIVRLREQQLLPH